MHCGCGACLDEWLARGKGECPVCRGGAAGGRAHKAPLLDSLVSRLSSLRTAVEDAALAAVLAGPGLPPSPAAITCRQRSVAATARARR